MRSIPARSTVPADAKWDLTSLYVDEATWDRDLARLERVGRKYARFQGNLGRGAEELAACLQLDSRVQRLAERLGAYAFLRAAEDQTNSENQRMLGRFQRLAAHTGEKSSFIQPEILGLPANKATRFLKAKLLSPYWLTLERILRYRPFTLSGAEERLLAMQGEMAQAAARTFRQLLDADLRFGKLDDGSGGKRDLTHTTFRQFLLSPKRSVRKEAFHQYYNQFVAHEHTLAATLSGSVQRDVYYSRARGYSSALAAALYSDDVPHNVYTQLIGSVRRRLPALHRYLELRRRKLKLKSLHQYDLEVPLVADAAQKHTWDQAVTQITASLTLLGTEYTRVLECGLRGRWCDRYPNQGKQSGAFCYGTYDAEPLILMNYKPDVLEDVFTLTHEAGHAMHSYYSARKQPFETYKYSIFVAEVASTFHEQLLSHHMLREARDDRHRAHLINREIDSIRATIIRQTMFAEYEKQLHESVEAGEPLTVAHLTESYARLLRDYFGPEFVIDHELRREGLRIPHFYRAFYVYKYATGLSAAIALSQQVLSQGVPALQRYLAFLGSGCSKYPLDLLRDAGIDMAQPDPVDVALNHFDNLVNELDSLI